jgi:hypothetical protein
LHGTADFGLKTLQIGSTIFGQSVNLLNDLGILHGRLAKARRVELLVLKREPGMSSVTPVRLMAARVA